MEANQARCQFRAISSKTEGIACAQAISKRWFQLVALQLHAQGHGSSAIPDIFQDVFPCALVKVKVKTIPSISLYFFLGGRWECEPYDAARQPALWQNLNEASFSKIMKRAQICQQRISDKVVLIQFVQIEVRAPVIL